MSELMEAKGKDERLAEKNLLATLKELGGKRVADDDLVFEGRRFVLPQTMTLRSAKKFIEQKIVQEEEVTNFDRIFRYRPWDGAHALQSALKKGFGTSGIGVAVQTMFGKVPPSLITIDTGVGEQTQVPWGQIDFPLLEAEINCASAHDPELGLLFRLIISAPRKYRAEVEGLFKLIENELQENSIYKGKAINGSEQPNFIDPYAVDKNKVVYAEEVSKQLDANIWSMLDHSQTMRELEVSLKRAVLLEGPYGTGKSLTAMLTAQKAVENGWTFLQCRPGKDDLGQVMQTALLYQPAVVFYEDVDTISQPGEPDKVSRLLDLFDGITSKGTELLVVLTTNHAELIHKGMVRPGRLDAVVHIGALDTKGVENLIRAVVPDRLLSRGLDYAKIGEAMEGFLPAFIKEAIERALRYAVARTLGKPSVLETDDFVQSATGLRAQLDLMNGAKEGNEQDSLAQAMSKIVGKQTGETLSTAFIDRGGDQFGTIRLLPQDEVSPVNN